MAPSEAVLRKVLWGLLVLVMVGVIGSGALSLLREGLAGVGVPGGSSAPPPVYGLIPAFSLIERSGRRVEGAELRRLIWVAAFIYTRCTDTCPLQSAQMAALQAEFAAEPDFRLVSITVDPDWDRPEVLARYARRFGADPGRRLFLTGEKGAIISLAQEGFRLPVAEPADTAPSPLDRAFPPTSPARTSSAPSPLARPALAHDGAAARPVLHSARFVLVDRRARVRGPYDSGDVEALARLRRDARALLRDPRP